MSPTKFFQKSLKTIIFLFQVSTHPSKFFICYNFQIFSVFGLIFHLTHSGKIMKMNFPHESTENEK